MAPRAELPKNKTRNTCFREPNIVKKIAHPLYDSPAWMLLQTIYAFTAIIISRWKLNIQWINKIQKIRWIHLLFLSLHIINTSGWWNAIQMSSLCKVIFTLTSMEYLLPGREEKHIHQSKKTIARLGKCFKGCAKDFANSSKLALICQNMCNQMFSPKPTFFCWKKIIIIYLPMGTW